MNKNTGFVFIFTLCLSHTLFSQDLLQLLEKEQKRNSQRVPSTFKMSRIAFGHSTEVRPENILEIFVANRFWNLPLNESQSFVADKMSSRIALEYSLSDRLTFGTGATSFDGLFDSFLKYRLGIQKIGKTGWPITITLFQSAVYDSSAIPSDSIADGLSDRLSFTSQVLVSKRFTRNFSLQLSPTLIIKKLRVTKQDPTSFFAMGIGARYKIRGNLSLVSEFYHLFNEVGNISTFDPFAFGINWELGDLMLQFMLTNSYYMAEEAFITRTANNFNFRNPNLNFGFNATYVIHFKNSLKN